MHGLIAPKPFAEYSPEDFHSYVSGMYCLRTKGKARPVSPAPGLRVSRTKAGALTVSRTAKQRAFAYVTLPELAGLAKANACGQADLWNLFKKKKYIITKTRMEAEQAYAQIKEIPW